MGWAMGTEAWIWMAAWAAVMVLVVWILVREPRHELHDDPGVILRARFARGEIREEEYLRAMAALDADPPSSHPKGARDDSTHRPNRGQEARRD
jgi:uncharacterized membrane protein